MQELKTAKQGKLSFSQYLNAPQVTSLINETLGDKKVAKHFIASISSAVALNPTLQECTPKTILTAALAGQTLNLSPSPQMGHFYMVPFNNTKAGAKDAQFIVGYRGMLQLAMRSGQYKNIVISEIKEGELKKYDPINEEYEFEAIQSPQERAKATTIGYYAKLVLINGFTKAIYWTREQMEMHALTYSKGYSAKKGYTFWEKNFDEMAKKTMIRQLISKWGIMSIEMQNAFDNDMAVIDEDGSKEYVDSPIQDDFIDTDYTVTSNSSAEAVSDAVKA